MTPLLFEAIVCVEGAEGGGRKLGKCEEAEFVGSLAGVEEHAKICRGHFPNLNGVLLLNIVGNEPVVFFVAKLMEVPPDVEGLLLQEEPIFCGKRTFLLARRRVEPNRDERCDGPEKEDRAGREQ